MTFATITTKLGSTTKRRRLGLLAILAVAAALSAGAGTASAADVSSTYGSPGWVSAHTYGVVAFSTDIFSQSHPQAAIGFDQLYLYASPASSQTQVAVVTSTLMSCWYGGTGFGCGSTGISHTSSWYVAPGAWRQVPSTMETGGFYYSSNTASYFMQLTVRWQTPSGVFLGQKTINYRASGDVICMTAHCSTSAGYGYWFGTV